MKKITFKQQVLYGIGLIILSGILSHVFHNGIFHNIAWVIYGLFFIINPVWPESWVCADPKKMKKGCRIGGVICIVIGILTYFGV